MIGIMFRIYDLAAFTSIRSFLGVMSILLIILDSLSSDKYPVLQCVENESKTEL